jgi:cytoskeleton protein RodZ
MATRQAIKTSTSKRDETTNIPVGEILRRTRKHYGQTLEDIEAAIRVKKHQLDAIEKGQIDLLPGYVYALGFVKAYAEHVGLDGDKVANLFKQQYAPVPPAAPELNFSIEKKSPLLPSKAIIAACVFTALVIIAVCITYKARHNMQKTAIIDVPDRLLEEGIQSSDLKFAYDDSYNARKAEAQKEPAAPITHDDPVNENAEKSATASTAATDAAKTTEIKEETSTATSTATDVTASALPPQTPSQSTEIPVEENTVKNTTEPSAQSMDTAPPAPTDTEITTDQESTQYKQEPERSDQMADNLVVTEATGQVAPPEQAQASYEEGRNSEYREQKQQNEENSPVVKPQFDNRLVLAVEELSWVEIRAEDGQILLSKLLKPGEQYAIPANTRYNMVAGNANGVRFIVDGKALPKMGSAGKVVRNVTLDPDYLNQQLGGR